MRLEDIRDNPGASKPRKRVGRGIGSGVGKTSGRGVKGQKARRGVAIKGYEGGQMPIYRRLPKRGFTNIFRKDFVEVTTGRLQKAIDAGKVDTGADITVESLVAAGVVRRPNNGIRLLVNGDFNAKVNIAVAGASKGAIAVVDKAGGTVTLLKPKPAASADDASDA